MNKTRGEFEAQFPVPEKARYADGEYVWTTHPTPHPYNQMYLAWCAAHAKYGTTNSSKWRVDDLVQDVNGDIFTIEGFKGDKLLIKDASENLWLTLADELTWHSRATQEEQ